MTEHQLYKMAAEMLDHAAKYCADRKLGIPYNQATFCYGTLPYPNFIPEESAEQILTRLAYDALDKATGLFRYYKGNPEREEFFREPVVRFAGVYGLASDEWGDNG